MLKGSLRSQTPATFLSWGPTYAKLPFKVPKCMLKFGFGSPTCARVPTQEPEYTEVTCQKPTLSEMSWSKNKREGTLGSPEVFYRSIVGAKIHLSTPFCVKLAPMCSLGSKDTPQSSPLVG